MQEKQVEYVLVIDDQAGIRMLLAEVFSRVDIEARTVASGEDTLKVAGDDSPHLVMVDMKMPEMDGLDTIVALRAAGIQAPCYLMTGLAQQDTRIKAALNLPGVFLLEKPFDVVAVRRLVRQPGTLQGQEPREAG